MIPALASVAALLLSAAILLAGSGLQITLLPIRAQIEGFSTVDIGIFGSTYYLGFAAGCLLGAHTVRRVGHIRVFTAMSAIASAVALAHALVLSPPFWWVARAITGFCFAVLYMVIESWLNERATNETRGAILSTYLVINLTVITLGQMMVTLADPRRFPLFAVASILVSLAAVPVAFTAAAAPAPIRSVQLRLGRLFRLSPVGVAGCFAVGLANGAFWTLGPSFARDAGLDVTGVALFMSAAVLAGALGQWPLGRASDRIDRRVVLVVVGLGAAIAGLVLVAMLARQPSALLYAAAGYGFFAFPIYGISAAHMNDFVSSEDFVEASSGLLLVFAAGAVAGPLVASTAMGLFGPSTLYVFTATVHFALAAFALGRKLIRERPPEKERTDFLVGLEAVNTVSQVFEEEAALEAREGDEPTSS